MKYISSLILLSVCTSLGLVTNCLASGGGDAVWQGLCIPKQQIKWIQPGSVPQQNDPVRNMISGIKPHLDTSEVPSVSVYFSGEDLANAVKGYISSVKGDLNGQSLTYHLGSVVMIKTAKDAIKPNAEANIDNYKSIWDLSRRWAGFTWKGAKVVRVPNTQYYKVIPKDQIAYEASYTLLTINPYQHKENDPEFGKFNSWYIGTCGPMVGLGFECQRAMLGDDYYVQYTVDQENIRLIPMIDKFMNNKIEEWKSVCAELKNKSAGNKK